MKTYSAVAVALLALIASPVPAQEPSQERVFVLPAEDPEEIRKMYLPQQYRTLHGQRGGIIPRRYWDPEGARNRGPGGPQLITRVPGQDGAEHRCVMGLGFDGSASVNCAPDTQSR